MLSFIGLMLFVAALLALACVTEFAIQAFSPFQGTARPQLGFGDSTANWQTH